MGHSFFGKKVSWVGLGLTNLHSRLLPTRSAHVSTRLSSALWLFSPLPPSPPAPTPTTKGSPRTHFPRTFASDMDSSKADEPEFYKFGPYKISVKEVFYTTQLSYVFVNLRPISPGHVLVCPKREVKRVVDLTPEETSDLWLTAQKVGGQLERHFGATSLTFSIQDGPQAGQTVPHVHIHIVPRRANDFENNDEIYVEMDIKEGELKARLDLDKERKDRTREEMAQEADELRALFT